MPNTFFAMFVASERQLTEKRTFKWADFSKYGFKESQLLASTTDSKTSKH